MDGNDMSYNTWVQQCQQTEGFGRVTVKDRMWISDIVCQVYLFPSDWNRTQEVPQTVSPPLMLPFHPNWLASFGLVSLQVQRPLNLLQCPWQHDRQILARCDLLCLTGNQTWGGDGRPWHLRNELVQPLYNLVTNSCLTCNIFFMPGMSQTITKCCRFLTVIAIILIGSPVC